MAIVINNESLCPICGEVLDNNCFMFPPLISNTKDPLFIFSDSCVHSNCLYNHPKGKIALSLREKYMNFLYIFRQLSEPRNTIVIGLLSSDEQEKLAVFNFTLVNKSDTVNWERKNHFIDTATKYIDEGKWVELPGTSNVLKGIIENVNNAINLTN